MKRIKKPGIVYRRTQRRCYFCKDLKDNLAHPQYVGDSPPPKRAPGICMECAARAAYALMSDAGLLNERRTEAEPNSPDDRR